MKSIIPLGWPQSRPGFFLHLKPIEGSIETILELDKKFDVWFLSRPSIKNIHCYSEKAEWIKDHLGEKWLEKLIISPNKSLLKGDYLIDDGVGFGQEEFEGKFIRFGSEEFPDWKSILKFFNKEFI
jgi:5'(3')-deoxyribonucleotidase